MSVATLPVIDGGQQAPACSITGTIARRFGDFSGPEILHDVGTMEIDRGRNDFKLVIIID